MRIFVGVLDGLLISFYNVLLFHFFAVKRNKNNKFTIFAVVVLGCIYCVFSYIFYEWFYIKATAIVGLNCE